MPGTDVAPRASGARLARPAGREPQDAERMAERLVDTIRRAQVSVTATERTADAVRLRAPGTSRKVLLYVHALAGGGAERVWALLASGLAALGHDVLLAVDYEAVENLALVGPRVRLVVLGGGHVGSIVRLARLIRRERPDVSISALASSNVKHTFAALLAGRLSRCIISYHGYRANERGFLSRVGYAATPLLTRIARRTVAVSDGLARYLQTRLAADAARLVRIYNPVSWTPFPEAPGREAAPIVLAVGRLDREKDHLHLLHAFARLRRTDAHLVILGEGEERPAIEAEIVRLGLEGRVRLPGYVTDPSRTFARAACLVLSSRVEAFGLAVVEALGHGLPVISTDCDGPREILSDPGLGTIVPGGDADAMARAIDAALDDRGDTEGRRRRAADFSTERAVAAYSALIESVCTSAESDPCPAVR